MTENVSGSTVGEQKDGMSPNNPIDLDYVLVNELGQFGRYQLINMLLIATPMMMTAFFGDFIFAAAAVPHRCRISKCGESSKYDAFEPEWILNAIPTRISGSGIESCQRFSSIGNGTLDYCPEYIFNQEQTVACDSFVYARDDSLVSEFDLGCQEWLRALAGTVGGVGGLLALPLTGYVSDRWGRRVALVISIFNLATFGLIRAFSINYPMYLSLLFLQSALGAGTFSTAYIFATELVGPKFRVVTSATCSSMFAVSQVILGGVAWLVQPWRFMIMILHIPCFLALSYYWILPESVRWLLSKGKHAEAKVILDRVARVNRTQISEKSLGVLMNPPTSPATVENKDEPSMISTIVKSRVLLRRILTTPIWWITTTFVYYGLSYNSISLSDNMHLNYILTCAIEIPGYYSAVLLLDWIGRKITLSAGYLLSAACNVAVIFIPADLSVVRLIVTLVGKFSISVVFTSLYLYTSELYPTQYRHGLVSFSSMIGRVGIIIAPLTPVLTDYWHGLPSILFATMGLISSVLVLTQPETLGTKMPDTLAEAEALGQPKSGINRS